LRETGESLRIGEVAMIDPRAYPYIAVVVLLVAVACAVMIRDIIRDIMKDKKRGLR
jgi:hypothetical protein